MKNLQDIIDSNFLEYANYVVKDRAIPQLYDGLKPVQRRVLHAMFRIDDGKFNKVANIVGESMKYHPHGDSSIFGAIVNIANKDFFIEKQGNFGNPITGDNAAAARYIEARLTPLSKEILFNKKITDYIDSYDGRNQEPVTLPAKIPVLLLLGCEGIGVGMRTSILPHNFNELLDAQIAYLNKMPFNLYPDFLQGGIVDVSEYADGNGKVKARAIIEKKDNKTLIIKEIPYSTTTETVIGSIEKAARRGKLKVNTINDYTTSSVEIEINLGRGVNAQEAENALYAFTDCEVSISTELLCIENQLPVKLNISEVIAKVTEKLKINLERELSIDLKEQQDLLHKKQLAQIFIEKRLYKLIEELTNYDEIIDILLGSLEPFRNLLERDVTKSDIEKLLDLQIRRISRFDIDKNRQEIQLIKSKIQEINKNLLRLIPYTIDYINYLKNKYGQDLQRKTRICNLQDISAKEAAIEDLRYCYDRSTGYIGTEIKKQTGILVSEFSHVLIFFRSGKFKVCKVKEKDFVGKDIIYYITISEWSKNNIIFSLIYRDLETNLCYSKRFSEIRYILDREYSFIPNNCKLEFFTLKRNLKVVCFFERLPRMRSFYTDFEMEKQRIKSFKSQGNKISSKLIVKIEIEDSKEFLDNCDYKSDKNGGLIQPQQIFKISSQIKKKQDSLFNS